MKTATVFSAGMFCGALTLLLFLAYPLAKPNDDMLAIASLRDLGCDPYIDNHRALHSGCQKIKHVELNNADKN